VQICEGLGRQQELIGLLNRRMKYDRLGVNDALLQFENDLSKGILPEPLGALPLLDQIAGDLRLVEIARQRARALGERVRPPIDCEICPHRRERSLAINNGRY